ncbi:MAG TPA: oxalate/formate MFS antiporter [Thermodesulfovibrionales bacterium]|nr:oxalate/formate MFS antiporter [Thermodesulfovibrionales bacterium]
MAKADSSDSKQVYGSFIRNNWVQLVAGVCGMAMISSLQYAWTLFVPELKTAFQWSLPSVQLAFAIFIALMTYAAPLTGFLLDKFGTRLFFTVAGLCVAVGWGGMGYADNLATLYVLYGTAGIGASFIYTGGIAAALKWFPKKRGLASGIMAAGFGSGAAPFIPIIGYLIAHVGYKEAFLYSGIGFAAVLLVIAQVLRFPSWESAAESKSTPVAGKEGEVRGCNPVEMFKTGQFYLIYGIFVGMAIGYMFLTPSVKPFAKEIGIASNVILLAASLYAIANGAGRVVWGIISDKIGREKAMAIDFVICGIAYAALPIFGKDPILFTAILCLAFFCCGPMFAFFPPLTADRYGQTYLATNYGIMYSAKGFGGLIGGALGSVMVVKYGWTAAFFTMAILAIVSAMGALILRKIEKPALICPVRPAPLP